MIEDERSIRWPPNTFFKLIHNSETVWTENPEVIYGNALTLAKNPTNLIVFNGNMECILSSFVDPGPGSAVLRGLENTFEIPTYWKSLGGVFKKLTPEVRDLLTERFLTLNYKWSFGPYTRVFVPVSKRDKVFSCNWAVGMEVREYIDTCVKYYCPPKTQ